MVKKVGGPKKTISGDATRVEPSGPVKAGKVDNVSNTKGAEKKDKSARVQKGTRMLTAQERDQLHRMITEEADKLFGEDGMPSSQRETVEKAVRQTIDAAIIEED